MPPRSSAPMAAHKRRKVRKAIPVGAIVECADNTGAKKLKVVQVVGAKTRLRRLPSAGIGDHVKVTVYKGPFKLRKQVLDAVIVRQRAPYRRPSGEHVMFEDNAAVLITPEGQPMGTEIRGPIAVEAADLWPKLANIASLIY